jgi:hypothetical protein
VARHVDRDTLIGAGFEKLSHVVAAERIMIDAEIGGMLGEIGHIER